jgi:hypothetical protein
VQTAVSTFLTIDVLINCHIRAIFQQAAKLTGLKPGEVCSSAKRMLANSIEYTSFWRKVKVIYADYPTENCL